MTALPRPADAEYAEYYQRYIALVPVGDIVHTLKEQLGETLELFESVPEDGETHRYAEGKWSVREVVGHLLDTERVFAFRALSMARQDGVDLPGMDQDEWSNGSHSGERPLSDLLKEWTAVRRANVHFFATLDGVTGERSGCASGYSFTVRSFPWIIAGHELWHRSLLVRDYLGGAA